MIFCPTVKSQVADTFLGKSVAKVTPLSPIPLLTAPNRESQNITVSIVHVIQKIIFCDHKTTGMGDMLELKWTDRDYVCI